MTIDFYPSATEICAILRACAKAGVQQITLGQLSVTFSDTGKPNPVLSHIPIYNTLPQAPQMQLPIEEERSQTKYIDEVSDYLLAVEDPVAFEEQQLRGHNG